MSSAGVVAGAGVAAAAAIANAIKASGAIVRVEPDEFLKVISRIEKPLVVHATGGAFTKHHRYIAGYKGLVFFTKSPEPLQFTRAMELIAAKKVSIPD